MGEHGRTYEFEKRGNAALHGRVDRDARAGVCAPLRRAGVLLAQTEVSGAEVACRAEGNAGRARLGGVLQGFEIAKCNRFGCDANAGNCKHN